jgi:hypothetical protein
MADFRHIYWANRFEQIASRFRAYQRIMDHWNRVLPNRILHVDYEETVFDLKSSCRKIVDWCDLDWEPACLKFHQNRRRVRTASWTEVRRPIYQSSVGRWKYYESELSSLFDMLDIPTKTIGNVPERFVPHGRAA